MFRKDLIPMLLGHGMTVTEISAAVGQKGKTTLDDLQHLLKSIRHTAAHCAQIVTHAMPYRLGKHLNSGQTPELHSERQLFCAFCVNPNRTDRTFPL